MFKFALILGDIRSTHNVGSILRTADGFGVSEIYYGGYTPYPVQPKDIRLPHESRKTTDQIHKTALGAERLPSKVFTTVNDAIQAAKSDEYRIVALEQSKNSVSLRDYKPTANTAILLGNEVTGISSEILSLADVILELDMMGKKESFNVSIAAAVALYQLTGGFSNE